MINPIIWLWNVRHRKLLEETKAITRLYQFLRYDCGLRGTDRLSAKNLKMMLSILKE
jgi:hypothetical protein